MNSHAIALIALFFVLLAACARSAEPKGEPHAAPLECTLIGQVLLPRGLGSRGVEVQVMIASSDKEPHREWVLFDEHGRFAHSFHGRVTQLEVTAGAEVHRIDGEDLPKVDRSGQIDVGKIDLRDRLTQHRMRLHAAGGKPGGDVRVGMWIGLPPVGPQGESVSLGSRQFPPIALGSEMEWLLPLEAQSIYFLVERPSGSGRGTEWRSGRQQLFGPYTSNEVPTELTID